MNALVFDTDIVSTFSKIRALHLLKGLFPNQEFYLALAVREDLIAANMNVIGKVLDLLI